MRKWIIIGVVAVVLAVGATVAVASSSSGSGKKPLLITDTAVVRDLRDEVTVPGTLERAEQRTVSSVSTASATSASASGGASTVNAVYLKDGSALLPGDSILAIDGRKSVAYPGTLPFFRRLDVGAEGSDVLELKTILRDAGFQPGPLDTLYTEQTRFALGQWQASKGYPGASPSTSQAVNVALQQGAGYQLGAQTSAGLTIGPPPARNASVRLGPDVTVETLPTFTIVPTSTVVAKGAAASFVVSADSVSPSPISFSVSLTGAGASDVIPPAGPFTLPANAASTTIQILTQQNNLVQPDRTLTVELVGNANFAPGTPGSASVTIVSTTVPQLTLSGTTTVLPGQSATVTVTANQAPVQDTQVNFTVGGTAVADNDFVAFAPSVLLPAGQTQATLTVTTKTSNTVKPDRRIVLGLAASSAYSVGSVSTATITIQGQTGDAAIPVVTIAGGNIRVNAGTPAQFTVSLDRPLAQSLELSLWFGGDAVQGSDFNPPGGIVTVPPNQTSLAVTVPTLNNGIVQDDKSLTVGLVPEPTYTVGSPGSAGIVIVSTTLPKVSISGSASAVGLGGGAVFRITADQAPVKDTSVQYTVTGTAQQGKDIQPVTGSAVIPAGATTVDVTILTLNTNVFFAPTDMIVTTTSGGRLGQIFVKEGQVVPVGTPLFTITEPNIAVTLQASAADRTKLKVGQTATVQVQGSNTTAPGVITQLDDFPTTDTATKKQSFKGTVQVQGDLGAAGGTPVTVNVVVQERKGALTVPIAAVKQNGEGKDVVRLIDLQTGQTREVTVVTGLSEGSYIEVTSGLKAQDVVVVQLDQAKSG